MEVTKRYHTLEDNQTVISVRAFQGERPLVCMGNYRVLKVRPHGSAGMPTPCSGDGDCPTLVHPECKSGVCRCYL